jgi:hypothetical protein
LSNGEWKTTVFACPPLLAGKLALLPRKVAGDDPAAGALSAGLPKAKRVL